MRAAVALPARVRARPRPWVRPDVRIAWLFLLPAFVVLAASRVVPFAQSPWRSL
jgi:hypothetical protein